MNIIAVGEDGNEIYGKIRFTMPSTCEETLIKLEITKNIFEQTELDSDFLLEAQDEGLLYRLKSSCIASCQEKFTDENGDKIKGRGACKA